MVHDWPEHHKHIEVVGSKEATIVHAPTSNLYFICPYDHGENVWRQIEMELVSFVLIQIVS